MRVRRTTARASAVVLAFVLTSGGAVHGQGTSARSAPRADTVRFSVAPDGNEARYRVREQLAGFDLPNDAVGKTAAVTGSLVLDEKGVVVAGKSEFVIELTGLTSDQDRRDNYLRRNTLQTEQFPRAVFAPTAVQGLASPLPSSGEAKFQLNGDLTIKHVTKPVTWDVTARFADGAITGLAQTKITFADFGLSKPRLARVLSVDDDIRLEYEFRLVPAR